VKGETGICAGVRWEERTFLLEPKEQAFEQCEVVLEVCIEDLVKSFCCSFWDIKTSVIGRVEFRCFPIGGIGASTKFEDVCLLKSPPWLSSLICVSLESWVSSFGGRTGGDWSGMFCLASLF
jgi:hypothetical protein